MKQKQKWHWTTKNVYLKRSNFFLHGMVWWVFLCRNKVSFFVTKEVYNRFEEIFTNYHICIKLQYALKSSATDLYRHKIYLWYKSSVSQHKIKWKKEIKKGEVCRKFNWRRSFEAQFTSLQLHEKKHSSVDIYQRFWFFNHR